MPRELQSNQAYLRPDPPQPILPPVSNFTGIDDLTPHNGMAKEAKPRVPTRIEEDYKVEDVKHDFPETVEVKSRVFEWSLPVLGSVSRSKPITVSVLHP